MILKERQIFHELKVKQGNTLSEELKAALEEISERFTLESILVKQVIKHDDENYTVIINIEYPKGQ